LKPVKFDGLAGSDEIMMSAVVITTVVYAAIVPILWLVPKKLTATADGEEVALEHVETPLSLGLRKS
jgi:hypothetical protein